MSRAPEGRFSRQRYGTHECPQDRLRAEEMEERLIQSLVASLDRSDSKHADLVTSKNKECDARFVPFIKMVKGINREASEPIEPSFLLEVMGLDLVLPPFDRYRDEIRFFLASVADRITDDWPDPAGLGPDVNSRVPAWRRSELVDIVRGWLATAEEGLLLENDGRDRAAVEKWRELFGWRMPRP
jgi:hypothetical protein